MAANPNPASAKSVIGILQSRTTSKRLPRKVLLDLGGRPMIIREIERIRRARRLDAIVLATSDNHLDDELASIVAGEGIAVFRGHLDDVLTRFASAIQQYPCQHVVRLTGDCPFIDPQVIDEVVSHHLATGSDITTNAVEPTFPDGLDVEVVRSESLLIAAAQARLGSEREHVTQFIYNRPERFRISHYKGLVDYSHHRWTVDERADLVFVRQVFDAIYPKNPTFTFRDVLELLERRPELTQINARIGRNEGLATSLNADKASARD
jgi:spore coat polysaccharide biosynthesis protein SpsF